MFGWLSTSTTLATPGRRRVGALRQAHGPSPEIRPPAPDSSTVFLVDSLTLGFTVAVTLSGPADTDRVTSPVLRQLRGGVARR